MSKLNFRQLLVCFLAAFAWTQAVADLPDFTKLVERHQEAVVNISTTKTVKPKRHSRHPFGMHGFEGQDPFEDMLRRFFGEEPEGQQEYSSKSLGSGFLVSSDGYLMTNNHVVKDADEILVKFSDGRELVAEVIGTDKDSDLAVLKVNAAKLPYLKFGDAQKIKVGEWVLAIGSPFGFEHTVTAGIVSAKQRPLRNEQYVPFIQTDVAINPGNSGGPLFNMKGEVVGINAQIVSRTGGYLGISFAIPSDIAENVFKQIITEGKVTRGWLGIAFQPLDKNLASSFGLDNHEGALVASVSDDGPAKEAGLEPGDVIVKFDGQVIKEATDLAPLVGRVVPGTTVQLDIVRAGKAKIIKVKIAPMPSDHVDEGSSQDTKAENLLGVAVREITKDERKRYELEDRGLLIEYVAPKSAAAKAGLRRGDIILSINHRDLITERDLDKVLKNASKGQTVALLVNRRGAGQSYFALPLQ